MQRKREKSPRSLRSGHPPTLGRKTSIVGDGSIFFVCTTKKLGEKSGPWKSMRRGSDVERFLPKQKYLNRKRKEIGSRKGHTNPEKL